MWRKHIDKNLFFFSSFRNFSSHSTPWRWRKATQTAFRLSRKRKPPTLCRHRSSNTRRTRDAQRKRRPLWSKETMLQLQLLTFTQICSGTGQRRTSTCVLRPLQVATRPWKCFSRRCRRARRQAHRLIKEDIQRRQIWWWGIRGWTTSGGSATLPLRTTCSRWCEWRTEQEWTKQSAFNMAAIVTRPRMNLLYFPSKQSPDTSVSPLQAPVRQFVHPVRNHLHTGWTTAMVP